jgi:hypothetical protein
LSEIVIDNLNDKSGWSVDKTAKPNGIIEVGEYATTDKGPREFLIAGGLEKSLWIKVEGDNGNYAEKTISVDLTGYTEIVLHTISYYKGHSVYDAASDFLYKIDLGFKEYYLSTNKEFSPVRFKIPTGQTASKIKITCLHNEKDVLTISYMVASNPQIPLDFMSALKTAIEAELNQDYSLGTVTGTAGDSSIAITGTGLYVDRLSKVKIGGSNPEEHKVKDRLPSNGNLVFGELFDGKILKYNHTADPLTLRLPVFFGREQTEIISPAIIIWNYDENQLSKTNGEGFDVDTYDVSGGTIEVEQEGFNQILGMQIDCEAVSDYIIDILKKAARKAIYKKNLWVNGRKYDIDIVGPPIRVEATDLNTIPKVSYQIGIEFEESVWASQTQNFPLESATTVTVGVI